MFEDNLNPRVPTSGEIDRKSERERESEKESDRERESERARAGLSGGLQQHVTFRGPRVWVSLSSTESILRHTVVNTVS